MQFLFLINTPGPTQVTRRVVEASGAAELEFRVQNALFELNGITPAVFLSSVTISGAGDGDRWAVELVAAEAAVLETLDGVSPPGAPVLALLDPGNLTAACYKASDVRELAVQRDRRLGQFLAPIASITLEDMAGAEQGLQHMGLILLTFAQG